MKTKPVFLAIIFLITASLACQTAESRSEPTRIAIVQTAQPYFATPENWNEAPSACRNSLTQVGYDQNGTSYLSSGAVVEIESINWQNKEYFLYYILTTNHDQLGFKMGTSISLTAGFNGRLNFEYTVVDSVVLTDALGRKVDGSIVATIGESKAITPLNEAPLPITSENLISGTNLPKDQYYYSFGYPDGGWLPQYTKSQIVDSIKDPIFLYTTLTMQIIEDSQSVSVNGKSGGPTCNSIGQVVGIIDSSDGNLREFFVTPLPDDINSQYYALKNKVKQILSSQ